MVPIGSKPSSTPCDVVGCNRGATERGLCHAHYLRLVRLGDVLADRPLGRRVNTICGVRDCQRLAYARQLCKVHYRRRLNTGDVQADKPIREISGTGYVHHTGYRIVPVPLALRYLTNGEPSAAEHRLVMAQILGRPLYRDESVHHKNGDRLDNRRANLELWSRWQPRGQRVEDKVAYALELLRRYAPGLLSEEARHDET